MAEIKDKVVTVESLSALHEHNKKTYINKTGGDISGNFNFGNISSGLVWTATDGTIIKLRPYTPNNIFQITMQGGNWDKETGVFNIKTDGEVAFNKALPVESGGTGAKNGADGLANLFASGATVLSSYQYGDTLPAAGTKGRIFFKKLNN